MIFRNATSPDLQEMQQLYTDTISQVCSTDYDQDQINAWITGVKNMQRWVDLINDQLVLLAIVENRIAGYGSLKNYDYIDFFYIHKDHQRQGIANAILHELEKVAKSNNTKTLTSDISKTARPFFERKGFIVLAEQRNIRSGVELINYKMSKELG